MERFVTIHGHFYQPPRENPWLDVVEEEASARPYHDWNERISSECYEPNTASRIVDGEQRILRIVNNFSQISFDVGPTLLRWMEERQPETYQSILAADKESRSRFGGHGSAMAQAYNHSILPLLPARDIRTQVRWGLRDFSERFGRPAEGMWLPETAVNREVLDILAQEGVRFTLLSPHQATRTRPLGGSDWTDVGGGKIDPSVPYRISLPEGRSLSLFFYDGPVSHSIAFEHLLDRGEWFAQALVDALGRAQRVPGRPCGLAHVATDGETYGHHHPHGDMALAYALYHLEREHLARITNYGEFLELCPPRDEVEIAENSSWSCSHGVERWRADCGCRTGHPGWHQAWRAPLREALDDLRGQLDPRYEEVAGKWLRDPWAARDDYVSVFFHPGPPRKGRFLEAHAKGPLSPEEEIQVWRLLEMQRSLQTMYTSCGWFFDEVSGIGTVQVLSYAGRAIQLAEEVLGGPFLPRFLERLEKAPSNLPAYGNARRVYEELVAPRQVDLPAATADYLVRRLLTPAEEPIRVPSFHAEERQFQEWEAGRVRMQVGLLCIGSDWTGASKEYEFGLLHFGDLNLAGGFREARPDSDLASLREVLAQAFEFGDLAAVVRRLSDHFPTWTVSLRSLFREERRGVIQRLLAQNLELAAGSYASIYEREAPLMRTLKDLGVPRPRVFDVAAGFVLNNELRGALERDPPDLGRAADALDEISRWGLTVDAEDLSFTPQRTVERVLKHLEDQPLDLPNLEGLVRLLRILRRLPYRPDFWRAQNSFYHILTTVYPERREKARTGDLGSLRWVEAFATLGHLLSVRVE